MSISKLIASITLFITLSVMSFSQATDLIISEFGEGDGGTNKWMELYNGTGAAVDLSQYSVWRISNGGTWPEGTDDLVGTLNDGETFVIVNPNADAGLLAYADFESSQISSNGDDAMGLAKNGVLIDAVGEEGADPGNFWTVGSNGTTANHVLYRKSSVTSPNTDWDASKGTDDSNSEWTYTNLSGIRYDDSNIGQHTMDLGGGSSPEVIFTDDVEDVTLDPWTEFSVASTPVWSAEDRSGRYLEINNFDGGGAFAGADDWLISPEFDLTNYEDVFINFDHLVRFDGGNTLQVYVLTGYAGGDPTPQPKTEIFPTLDANTGSWDFVNSGDFDISAFDGQIIRIAFHYTSPGSASGQTSTNRIDNFTISGTPSTGGPAGVFFSEYFEDGDGRYLEIFNATEATVDLSGYYIAISENGGHTSWDEAGITVINLAGNLTAKGVFTVAENNVDILTNPDFTDATLFFNGDDAIGLFDADPTTGATPIDVIGTIGNEGDPDDTNNSEFYIYDDSDRRFDNDPSTENYVLVRKPNVRAGVSEWAIASENGLSEANGEWLAYGFADFDGNFNNENAGRHYFEGTHYPTSEVTVLYQDWSNKAFGSTDVSPWSSYDLGSNVSWIISPDASRADGITYVEMSNYSDNNSPANDWLISPRVDSRRLNNTIIDFTAANWFGGTSTLDLLVSTDYQEGGNPEDYTWTNISTIFDSNSPTYEFNNYNFDLSAYKSDNLYIGFQYIDDGAGDGVVNARLDNIMVYGTESADVAPTQIVLQRVSPSEPVRNLNFTLTVEAQDGNGIPMPVAGDVNFTLTLETGNGTLSTAAGTIMAGETSAEVVSTYDVVETIAITVTDDADNLTPNTLSNINVIDGPSSFVFTDFYGKGFVGVPHPDARLEARDDNGGVDTDFNGLSVTLEVVDANDNVVETFSSVISNGVVDFSNLNFSNIGDFIVRADANGLISNIENLSILDLPEFNEVVVPQYVLGTDDMDDDGRVMPTWALVEFSGLHPNTEYSRINSLSNADFSGNLEALQTDGDTRGQNINYDHVTDEFFYAGAFPKFSEDYQGGCNFEDNGVRTARYSTFVSDNNGEAQFWINTIPSSSGRLSAIDYDELWWVVELGFENANGRIRKYQTTSSSQPVTLGPVEDADYHASGIVDYSSELDARTIVSLWSDLSNDPSRPVVTAMVQDDGAIWQRTRYNWGTCGIDGYYENSTVDFYQEVDGYYEIEDGFGWGPVTSSFAGMDGGWAAYYPNLYSAPGSTITTPSNVTAIQTWGFYSKEAELTYEDSDGIWGSANTNAPNGETVTDKDLNVSYIPVNFTTPALEFTSFLNAGDYCNTGSDLVTWRAQGINTVTINLWIDGVFVETLFEDIPAVNDPSKSHDMGYVKWDISRSEYSEQNVQLEIVSNDLDNTTLTDYSAIFRVFDVPVFLNVSESQVSCSREQVLFAVTANGSEVQYRWYKDGELLEGETNAGLLLENVDHTNSGVYTCEIYNQNSNVCGEFISDEMVLYVTRDSEITIQPRSVGAIEGGEAFFYFDTHVNGFPELQYNVRIQWYKGDDALEDNDRISGSKSNYLNIKDIQPSDFSIDADYYAVVTGLCEEATTNKVSLIAANVNVLNQPQSQEVCEGGDFTLDFELEDADTRNIEYQWFRDGIALNENARFTGTKTATLNVLNSDGTMNGNYYCRAFLVTENLEFNSNVATISIVNLPVLTQDTPDDLEVEIGNAIQLNVIAQSSTPVSYQWFKDGTEINGETSEELLIPGAGADDAGEYYCAITNDCGTVNSTVTTVNMTTGEIKLSVVDRNDEGYALYTPVPNPIRNYANIDFELPKASRVTLKLISQVGQELTVLNETYYNSGKNTFQLNIDELDIPSGVYVVTFESNNAYLSQTVVISK